MKKTLAVSLLLAVCTGCFRTVIRTTTDSVGGEPISTLGISFLWGLTSVETAAACPGGLARAETVFPWWAFLIGGATGGLVMPVETRYWCAERHRQL